MPRLLLPLALLLLALLPARAEDVPAGAEAGKQIQIPAGQYIVGPPEEQHTVDLGAYEIDKYEVTIGDYAKFIEFCQKEPENEHNYDHPNSNARQVPHATADILVLLANATSAGATVFGSKLGGGGDPGVPVSLDCPIVGVSFWDAYAYARWKGRDLPTEEEWEAAARGAKGSKYPWGDELKIAKMNSNEGYAALKPGGNKPDDGYNYWAPVDKFSGDESPFKVVGMAGNVSEWVYKKQGARETPLVKGGSFATPPIALYDRLATLEAEDCWYVFPKSVKAGYDPGRDQPGVSEHFFKGDPITASTRCLFIGFRTVKRK